MIIREPDGLPFLSALEAASGLSPGEGYFVTSMVSNASEAELAAAGNEYPSDVLKTYLGTAGVSEQTRELARQVVAAAGAETPYAQGKGARQLPAARQPLHIRDHRPGARQP